MQRPRVRVNVEPPTANAVASQRNERTRGAGAQTGSSWQPAGDEGTN